MPLDGELKTLGDFRRAVGDLPDDAPLAGFLSLWPADETIDAEDLAQQLAVLPERLHVHPGPDRVVLMLFCRVHVSNEIRDVVQMAGAEDGGEVRG